jgi:hypothetical protein
MNTQNRPQDACKPAIVMLLLAFGLPLVVHVLARVVL